MGSRPLPSPALLLSYSIFSAWRPKKSGRLDLNRRRKPRPTRNPGWHDRGPLLHAVLCLSLGRPFRHRPRITGDRVCTLDPTSATARISPSTMIKPVPASIRAQVGNKLGTVLATSAPCDHNANTPRWRRASLGFADFKHHRNLFPMPQLRQTFRTQNPVPVRGCGFKSHLRYYGRFEVPGSAGLHPSLFMPKSRLRWHVRSSRFGGVGRATRLLGRGIRRLGFGADGCLPPVCHRGIVADRRSRHGQKRTPTGAWETKS